ncbi:protein hapless 2 [Holotrichia oblita]|uniref:Protein hapless 2 n=1 Tax=Holotrichia oblita TaxID=644536 RepID=A0ACB9TJY6_HOLOL|nr:protein hapless 2 [Holotrichia oblita]
MNLMKTSTDGLDNTRQRQSEPIDFPNNETDYLLEELLPKSETVTFEVSEKSLLKSESSHTYPDVSPQLQKRLNQEQRKSECCSKKMRCCKRHTAAPSNVEIRAVIARCLDPPQVCRRNRNLKQALNVYNAHNLEKFRGFDQDEPLIQSEVTKCVKKLILTIKMKNSGETNTQPQFIVIDHVYDPLSDKTVRLLNPYVIKMKQDQVSQAYGLKFMDFVNSQAKEQVYNKHDGNYTGCRTDCKKPTCGLVTYHGNIIPYSTGFCCSCDTEKNNDRQPQGEMNTLVAYSDPAYLYDAVQCPRSKIAASDRMKTNKKNKENKEKRKFKKETRKRNMRDFNVYYVDPRTEYLKPDLQRIRSRGSDKGPREVNEASNYKIQTMNDEYEDQLIKKANYPIHLDEKRKYEQYRKHFEKYKNQNYILQRPNQFLKGSKTRKQSNEGRSIGDDIKRNEKPSMHKILHRSDLKSSRIYHTDSGTQEVADDYVDETLKRYGKSNNRKTKKNVPSSDSPDSYDKRQIQPSGVQLRGGQNCADRYTPANADPNSYHESTHCLRFSPVWYGVYKMDKPVVDQEAIFQIFEKYETPTGLVRWKDLSKGKKIKLGTFNPHYKDELPTISMMFISVFDDADFCLDWNKLRLLIPEGVDISELPKYPEARNGPSEYLLIPTEKIVLSGDKCNVAGVGFEAFFKQPNRCSMPRGSCLHHQPYHLWHYDKTLERNGKKGCFFLKHHGKLSKNPIRKNDTSHEKFLSLNFYGEYVSMVDMEINADFNAILRPTSAAIITEVYIDSTCSESTHLTIKLSNSGLLSSQFKVRVCDCPLELEGKFHDLQSDLVVIPPQHQHIFRLNYHSKIVVDIFHCSVEALNAQGELVALRRIKIQKSDRCICTWHCLCACIGSSTGLKCVPMKIDHYHAAGFKGGMPVSTYADHVALPSDIYRLIFFIFLFIVFTFLLLGLTKALLGLCSLPIGTWGLNVLLDLPKPMNKYYDGKLAGRFVVYDEEGWPIHPDTGRRVRNIPLVAEFCTNIMFFFSYPTIIFLMVIKRLCCPFYSYERVKKPKPKKDPRDWFRRRKCTEKTCDYKLTQTDDDKTDVSGDGSKSSIVKPKKKKKVKSVATDATGTKKQSKWICFKKVKCGKAPASKRKLAKPKTPKAPKKKKTDTSVESSKSVQSRGSFTGGDAGTVKLAESKRSNLCVCDEGKGDIKHQKPMIKVSIREHKKSKSRSSCCSTPKKKKSIEISDNPYYYSSTENLTTYSSASPVTSRTTTNKSRRSSKTSSIA